MTAWRSNTRTHSLPRPFGSSSNLAPSHISTVRRRLLMWRLVKPSSPAQRVLVQQMTPEYLQQPYRQLGLWSQAGGGGLERVRSLISVRVLDNRGWDRANAECKHCSKCNKSTSRRTNVGEQDGAGLPLNTIETTPTSPAHRTNAHSTFLHHRFGKSGGSM